MALLLNCGAVFLHIPKTGGLWVRQVLEDEGLVHHRLPTHEHADMERVMNISRCGSDRQLGRYVAARRIEKVFRKWPSLRLSTPDLPTDTFTFCFVRHPLKWYPSWYRYMIQEQWPEAKESPRIEKWTPFAPPRQCRGADFNDTMRRLAGHFPGYASSLFDRYAATNISFVGKQENLTEDLIAVLRKLNVNFDEDRIRGRGKINATKSPSSDLWDPELKRLYEKLDYRAIYRFGYDQKSGAPSA